MTMVECIQRLTWCTVNDYTLLSSYILHALIISKIETNHG